MDRPLIVITGGSSGIGLATAQTFARPGHPLLLVSRHIKPLPALADHPVVYAQVDVADYDGLSHAILDAEARYGITGCLVNNAGLANARSLDELEPKDYEREINTNLLGTLHGIKAVLGRMVERQSGTIINISSVSDRKTSPMGVAYTASKYAVRALSECLREAEGKHGIRVMNIAPGYIRTNIHEGMGISFEEYCGKLGNPDFMTSEELADIIYYCYALPAHICVRELVVTPTRTVF